MQCHETSDWGIGLQVDLIASKNEGLLIASLRSACQSCSVRVARVSLRLMVCWITSFDFMRIAESFRGLLVLVDYEACAIENSAWT